MICRFRDTHQIGTLVSDYLPGRIFGASNSKSEERSQAPQRGEDEQAVAGIYALLDEDNAGKQQSDGCLSERIGDDI